MHASIHSSGTLKGVPWVWPPASPLPAPHLRLPQVLFGHTPACGLGYPCGQLTRQVAGAEAPGQGGGHACWPMAGWSRTLASRHTAPCERPTCLRPGPRGSAEVQALSQSGGTARKPGLLFSLCDPRAGVRPGTCRLHLLRRVLFPGCFLGFRLIFVPLISSLQMDHDPRNPAYIATQGPLPATVADFWQVSLRESELL